MTMNLTDCTDSASELCDVNQLSKESIDAAAVHDSFPQLLTFCIASLIGLSSMLYTLISRYFSQKPLTLHFVGIRRPSTLHKSQFQLLKKKTDLLESTLCEVQTKLVPQSTIADLKQLIRKLFSISDENDILISYQHTLITLYKNASELTLAQFGITNHSLLTLAICANSKTIASDQEFPGYDTNFYPGRYLADSVNSDPVQSVNQLFRTDLDSDSDCSSEDESEDNSEHIQFGHVQDPRTLHKQTPKKFLEPFIGYDIIMQEPSYVYRMPKCGHEMSRESLYEYAMQHFKDDKNISLRCPHHVGRAGQCKAEWSLGAVLEVLRHETAPEEQQSPAGSSDQENENESKLSMEPPKQAADLMKLELLSSRNAIQNHPNDIQKCPKCKTLYFKTEEQSACDLNEIKTSQDIAKNFKFQCLFCEPVVKEVDPEAEAKEKARLAKLAEEKKAALEAQLQKDVQEAMAKFDENDQDSKSQLRQAAKVNHMFDMFGEESEDEHDSDMEDEKEDRQQQQKAAQEQKQRELEEKKQATNEFCFCCGEVFLEGHVCGSFKEDLVEILRQAPVQKIGQVEGVPSIRACPNCCQLLFHIDCCKHMKCRSCKTNFCHVCLKPKLNGNWQCGCSSDVCPVAARQTLNDLPDNIVITRQAFKLFEELA